MTSSHIFFIPLVMLVGLVLGIALGRRSILVQQAEEERQKQLAQRRAARAQQPANPAGAAAPQSSQPTDREPPTA